MNESSMRLSAQDTARQEALMKELSAECSAGKLTVTECCKRLGISRGVWYREVEKITA